MNLSAILKEAWEYEDWVLRKAPLKRLSASERGQREAYHKSFQRMMDKYSPIYDELFKEYQKSPR